MTYIISQVLAFCALALLLLFAFLKIDKKTILYFQVAVNILFAVHYFLLKAYTGASINFITAFVVFHMFL